MDHTETHISQRTIHDYPPCTLIEDQVVLPDGKKALRTYVRHPGGVVVMAVNDRHEVALVHQWRHPIHQETLEFPAGKLDKVEHETLEDAARRELREETGLSCATLVPLGHIYASPVVTDEVLHLFFATGLTAGSQDLDEDEFLDASWMDIQRFAEKIANGEIQDAKTLCAYAIAHGRGLV